MSEHETYNVQWLMEQLERKRESVKNQIRMAMSGDRFDDIQYFTEKLNQLDDLDRKLRTMI